MGGRPGFTLIEVITVMAIIGVTAGIVAPALANQIHRYQLKGYVYAAKSAEDVIMSFTGLQYAKTASGNPQVVNWLAGETTDEERDGQQYVYVDSRTYTDGKGMACFRLAPANAAALTDEDRKSAGMKEFYNRTMNNLPPPAWRVSADAFEQRLGCSLYFLMQDSNIKADFSGVTEAGAFVKYNLSYSEYYMEAREKHIAVYHGVKFHNIGTEPGDPIGAGTKAADAGWHVYEVNDAGALTYIGSL